MEFDALKAYKNSMNDKEAKQKYDEGWELIFGKKEEEKIEADISQ